MRLKIPMTSANETLIPLINRGYSALAAIGHPAHRAPTSSKHFAPAVKGNDALAAEGKWLKPRKAS